MYFLNRLTAVIPTSTRWFNIISHLSVFGIRFAMRGALLVVILLSQTNTVHTAPKKTDLLASHERVIALLLRGRFYDAIPLAQKLVAESRAHYGETAPIYALALVDHAQLLVITGRFAEADSLLQQAVTIYERNEPEKQTYYPTALTVLAQAKAGSGQFGVAEQLVRRAVTIYEKNAPEKHPFYPFALNTLATILQNTSRFAEAESLHRRALDLVEKFYGAEHPVVSVHLIQLANFLFMTNRPADAEPLFRRAITLSKKGFGTGHPYTAGALNNFANFLMATGHIGAAEPFARRAIAIFEQLDPEKRIGYQEALNTLAQLLKATNRFTEAEPLYRRALENNERVHGREHPNTLISVNNLASLYQAQGLYTKAEPLYLRALEANERVLGKKHPGTLTTVHNLATLYYDYGLYTKAEPFFHRALKDFELVLGKEHPTTLTTVNSLGALYQAQGRYTEAERFDRRALISLERVLGKEHPQTLITVNNLASLYQAQGRYVDAEPLYRRALETRKKILGNDDPLTVSSVNNLATLYEAEGHYAEAEPLYRSALKVIERVLGKEHPNTLISVNNLAGIYYAQGRYADAEPLIRRAFEASERVLGKDHLDTLKSMNDLAELYQAQGRYVEAEPLFHRVLEASERVLGKDHPFTLANLSDLARFYFMQGDWNRAAKFWRHSTVALANREQRRASAQLPVGKRKSETEQQSSQFQNLVKAVYRLEPKGPMPNTMASREMFVTAQWAQASKAAASLAQMLARGAKGDAALAKLVRERQDLVAEWQKLDAWRNAAFGQETAKRNAKAEAENSARLVAIDKRIAEIDKRLTVEFPDYAAVAIPAPLATVDVQAQLGPDEALVLFLDTLNSKPTPEETFVWVVTKNQIRWFRSHLGSQALTERVQALRCGLDPTDWVRDKTGEWGAKAKRCVALLGDESKANNTLLPFNNKALGIAHELYKELLSPAADLIADKRLLIVTSGPLTTLPFQILVTEAPDTSLSDLRDAHRKAAWLVKSHAITVLPSVSNLAALRREKRITPAPQTYLGIGDPILTGGRFCKEERTEKDCRTPETAPVWLTEGTRLSSVQTRGSFWRGTVKPETLHVLGRLCSSAFELRCVAKSENSPREALLLGEGATEAAIKALNRDHEKLSRYRIIHFATHALLVEEPIAEAGLVLTPPKTPTKEDDGLLTSSEITELRLNADWVILSACNTAVGDKRDTQALSGLARAFFYAGARALLVSHWAVDSSAAVNLTTATFAKLQTGPMSKAKAFQQAMIELIKSPKLGIGQLGKMDKAHPAYWAPFILVGDGR